MKVKATFVDAWAAYEEAAEKAKTRKKQEDICQELYEKVYQVHCFRTYCNKCLFLIIGIHLAGKKLIPNKKHKKKIKEQVHCSEKCIN